MGEDETAIESVPRTPSGRVCSLCHHSFDRRGARRRGRHAPDDVRGHRVKQFELAALLFRASRVVCAYRPRSGSCLPSLMDCLRSALQEEDRRRRFLRRPPRCRLFSFARIKSVQP